MPREIGSIIDPDEPGKPAVESTIDGVDGTTRGISDDPSNSGQTIFEPSTVRIGGDSDGGTKRNRTGGIDGRTREGRAARARAGTGGTGPASKDILGAGVLDFSGILISIHGAVAAFVHPSFEISDDEAEKLNDAIQQVAKQYPTGIDPKKLAWTNLVCVMAKIHGKRVWDLMLHAEKAPAKPPKEEPPKKEPQKTNSVPTPIITMPFGAGTGGGVGVVEHEG